MTKKEKEYAENLLKDNPILQDIVFRKDDNFGTVTFTYVRKTSLPKMNKRSEEYIKDI